MPALGLAHNSPSSYFNDHVHLNLSVENVLVAKAEKYHSNNHIDSRKSNPHSSQREHLPLVQSLPSTTSVKEIVEALKISGGVVIRNAVSHEDLDVIESKGTVS